jgi:hypothetical protein
MQLSFQTAFQVCNKKDMSFVFRKNKIKNKDKNDLSVRSVEIGYSQRSSMAKYPNI